MARFAEIIEVAKEQIIAEAGESAQFKYIEQDVDNFCKLALAGYEYEDCCRLVYKSDDEAVKLGFDRLYEICVPMMNGEVAYALYQDAVENNNHQAQKLIAETRMNWTKTQNVNVNEHDSFINLYETEN